MTHLDEIVTRRQRIDAESAPPVDPRAEGEARVRLQPHERHLRRTYGPRGERRS